MTAALRLPADTPAAHYLSGRSDALHEAHDRIMALHAEASDARGELDLDAYGEGLEDGLATAADALRAMPGWHASPREQWVADEVARSAAPRPVSADLWARFHAVPRLSWGDRMRWALVLALLVLAAALALKGATGAAETLRVIEARSAW